MFDTLNIKELRLLLRELKAHHDIKGSSKMKKGQLVAALQERFILREGNLYLKEDTRPAKEAAKAKPRKKKEISPENDLKREIYNYLSGLSTDKIDETPDRELRAAFQALSGVDPPKALFKTLVEQVLTAREA